MFGLRTSETTRLRHIVSVFVLVEVFLKATRRLNLHISFPLPDDDEDGSGATLNASLRPSLARSLQTSLTAKEGIVAQDLSFTSTLLRWRNLPYAFLLFSFPEREG